MNFAMFAMMVLVGALAGSLAGFVMERGGYGLRWDMILGLVGSVVGSWIFGLRESLQELGWRCWLLSHSSAQPC